MASNVNKTDALHGEMPASVFKTKINPNWKALIEAIGEQDQYTADLIEEVKKQLFLKSASGRYLNYLGSGNNLERPRLIGLSDALYRRQISILANNPKQVKNIVDDILDLFYEKASTTAYSESTVAGPYSLTADDYLYLKIDEQEPIKLLFATDDFVDINAATAQEIVFAINKKYDTVFAEVKKDHTTNLEYVRLFTNTRGATGSVRVLGGTVQEVLRFEGYKYSSPADMPWIVTKIGDLITFTHDPIMEEEVVPGSPEVPFDEGSIEIEVGSGATFTPGTYFVINLPVGAVAVWFDVDSLGVAEPAHGLPYSIPVNVLSSDNATNIAATIASAIDGFVIDVPVFSASSVGPVITIVPISPQFVDGAYEYDTSFVSLSYSPGNDLIPAVPDSTIEVEDEDQVYPDFSTLFPGDWVTLLLDGNEGVFELEEVSGTDNSFSFRNLLGTAGSVTQTTDGEINFSEGLKKQVWHRSRRALSWQPSTGTFDIEMPATPILTRTELQGSAHVNGSIVAVVSRDSATQITLSGISDWPTSGTFFLMANNAIYMRQDADTTDTVISEFLSPFDATQKYTYSGKSGSALTGITPDLPAVAALNIKNISSISDTGTGEVTVVTSTSHGFVVGDSVGITGVSTSTFNGCFPVSEVVDSTTFKLTVPFVLTATVVSSGEARVEKAGWYIDGSLAVLGISLEKEVTDLTGPYIWDAKYAEYVISSDQATLETEITTGNTFITLSFSDSSLPDTGFIIFDYGLSTEEGPVSYSRKFADDSLLIDASYVFRYPHDAGSVVRTVRKVGPRIIAGNEYAAYLADPAVVRALIQQLINDVKGTGIFANFLIKYPDIVYSALDFYNNIDQE